MTGFRKLYVWVLQQAEKPYALGVLFFVALIEPCLLPLPPDALMVPMALARQRHNLFKLAAICTLGSVLGSLIGYGIGALAMKEIGRWLIDTYNLKDAFDHFHHAFHQWGMLVIIAKGAVPLIPVPFFLVTVASGVVHYDLLPFVFSVFIARGSRFFLEAALLHFFGLPIRGFIERHLPWVLLGIVSVAVIWVALVLR